VVIMCPYCLEMHEFRQTDICSNCGQQLPKKYLAAALQGSPICLGTFGLKSHGKTAFLSNLLLAAESLSKVALNAFPQAIDSYTSRMLLKWNAMDQSGEINLGETLLGENPLKERPTPLLLLLSNFPSGQSHIFVTYDLAGEVLDKAGSEPEHVRALHNVNTIWFIISLSDLMKERKTGHSMRDLFDVYEEAMEKLHISIKGKNILVVFTKADKLLKTIDDSELPRLPSEVYAYLEDDSYEYEFIKEKPKASLKQLNEENYWTYFRKMQEISEILRDFTNDYVSGGGAFLAMAQSYDAQVMFTINSAYGEEPEGGKLPRKAHPKRILDALIWAIELGKAGRPNQGREVALIVPMTIDGHGVANQDIIMRFYQSLAAHGEHVATYSVGHLASAYSPGTAPVQMPSLPRLPLVGPILDRLKAGTVVVLLADDKMPLDLGDFVNSPLLDRLLVVTTHREMLNAWLRHRAILQNEGDVEPIVSSFLNQLSAARPQE